MDRNEMLASTRAGFLQAFLTAVDQAIANAAKALFRKADFSFSAVEQRSLLDAQRVLTTQQAALRVHMQRAMEQLLTRSFQTTYSTFRPSFSAEINSNNLSLVDASQFEDQLRVDETTARFRNAADQQLRDLNIRIALLFEQNTIKERENPFRPWLFTRCIATAVEALGERTEINTVLIQQLGESIEESVPLIYNDINAQLAHFGIAAQLQLKVQRSHGAGAPLAGGRAESNEPATTGNGMQQANRNGPETVMMAPAGAPGAGQFGDAVMDDGNRGLPANLSSERVEQLMESVRRMAESSRRQGSSTVPASARSTARDAVDFATATEDAGQGAAAARASRPGRTHGVGNVLRRFFAGQPTEMRYQSEAHDHRTEPRMRIDAAAVSPAPAPVATTRTRHVSQPLAQSLQSLMVEHMPSGAAMFDQEHAVRNLILEQRAALAAVTRDTNEQMTIDVVAMLFEFILRDHQIPAEVRAQLGRLQFLVLKVALRESTLLTQTGHPARMLVNRIGAISVGLQQLDPSGARISTEICRIVEALLAGDTDSSTPFSAMLDEFDAFIAAELRKGDDQVERAVQVVENAQSRTLRFTHIAAQLDGALDRLTIDPFLRTFLSTTWVYVIERAERGSDAGARRFRALIPDLLWSIVARADADSRTQLFALLPIIVRTIREGLQLIGWSPEQQQPILDWLVEAHRLTLRGGSAIAAEPTLGSLHEHFAPFVTDPEDDFASARPITPKAAHQQAFLDEAIREADGGVQLLDQVAVAPLGADHADVSGPTSASAADALADTLADALTDPTPVRLDEGVLAQLRTGVAVELNLGGRPGTGRLSWVDQGQSTLVLTVAGRAAPTLISARMFQRMLANGRLRFMETEGLFERAVAAVLQSAEDLPLPA